MKTRFMILGVILLTGLTLIGCGGASNQDIQEFLAVMEADNYVFTQRDEDAMNYYEENMINVKYDLDVEVSDLYVGYVNSSERWAEVIILASEAQATAFQSALNAEAEAGRLVLRDGSIVLITFSTATVSLFNTTKG
ncbi:MAG: hypothetical protein V1761_01420 [bacterium]